MKMFLSRLCEGVVCKDVFCSLCRVLDIEPESEDEDALIERRRQMRKAIVQKYQNTQQHVRPYECTFMCTLCYSLSPSSPLHSSFLSFLHPLK